MKNRYIIYTGICFMLICIALSVYITRQDYVSDKQNVPMYASVEDNNGAVCKINAFTKDSTTYFFLPSYTDMSKVKLYAQTEVYIDDDRITEGCECNKYQLNKPYKLTVNNKAVGDILFVRSSNVAAMYINTATKSMNKIYSDIDYEEFVSVRLIDNIGDLNYIGEKDELSGRGNTTWAWDQLGKKPFSLNLREPHELLGMPEESKWALLANAKDRTNIKNKMVCDFAAEIGLCSPRSEYVDLYLNGEYNGLYLLSEKVDCVKQIGFKDDGSDFLFIRELSTKYRYNFNTENDQPVVVKKPSACSDEKLESLKKHVQSMENSIISESGIDEATGKSWTELIDIDSWVKKYLLEEVFMNSDGGFNSQFFYWMPDLNDKIYAGPAWDYDIVLGSMTGKLFALGQETWVLDNNHTKWYIALYKKSEFYNTLVETYKTDVLPKLEQLRDGDIDRLAREIEEASYMNGLRWHDMYSIRSETDALGKLKNKLSEHIDFLNSAWIDGTEYCRVRFRRKNAVTMYAPFSVEKGTPFYDMPSNKALSVAENTVWCNAVNGEIFDPNEPVLEDIDLCTSDEYKAKTGQAGKPPSLLHRIKTNIQAVFVMLLVGVLAIALVILFIVDLRRNRNGGKSE